MKRTLETCLAIAGLVAGGVARADDIIIVDTVAELQAAMVPTNAGRTIHVVAGDYPIAQGLVVPDGVTLEGEGVLDIAPGGLPVERGSGLTRILATSSLSGDVITLGDGSRIRGLKIEDVAGRPFLNTVVVTSEGDVVAAEIIECVLVNPNPAGVPLNGPSGRALAVYSRNMQNPDLPPYEGSVISAKLSGSILISRGGIFATNFAAESSVSLDVDRSIIGGGLGSDGGVSRPDSVHDSVTTIRSRGNWYRGPTANGSGWSVTAGSGPPSTVFGPIGATVRNTIRVHSVDDRIDGVTVGITSHGARRFFPLTFQGPLSDNHVELTLINTTISATRTDMMVWGAGSPIVGSPGDNNSVRLLMRGVTGSDKPSSFGNAYDSTGVIAPGTNRLEIVGNPTAFEHTIDDVAPPPVELFTTCDSDCD